jgi:hypothetical protein
MAQQPRRQPSSYLPPWECEISQENLINSDQDDDSHFSKASINTDTYVWGDMINCPTHPGQAVLKVSPRVLAGTTP